MADAEILPQSVRPDGTLRPQVRVKKGYVPPEEQEKFGAGRALQGPTGVPGADPADALVAKPKTKSALKNEKRKAKRSEEANKEVDKVAELAAALGGATVGGGAPRSSAPAAAPTPPPPAPVVASAPAEEAAPNEVEKKIRALKKKLRGVDDLIAKQSAGSELNAEQLSKIAGRGEIEAEISRWESLNNVDELQKEVKKLGKKLRQIEELEERAAKGEELNADQQGKISAKDKVVAEQAKLNSLLASLK